MSNPFDEPFETVVLCIIDGFGIAQSSRYNAISEAKTPILNNIFSKYPSCKLMASGENVGVPTDQSGNSEVGHMTIGSGRVLLQDIERINNSIGKNYLRSEPEIILLTDRMKVHGGKCHLFGMMSDGRVHGDISHVSKMAIMLASKGIEVILHMVSDGRDVDPKSALTYLNFLQTEINKFHLLVRIGTICGRYYAMDRDNRWDRTSLAYKAMVLGEGTITDNFEEEINNFYGNGITDEFFTPLISKDYKGMNAGDSIIIANYRSDRIVQIATALTAGPTFTKCNRGRIIGFLNKVSMTQISKDLSNYFRPIFKARTFPNTLGEVIQKNSLKQLRVSETEKYPHVTYFFNAGREEPFEGEERIHIPSPRAATYDLVPEMAAMMVATKVVEAIGSAKYKFIVCNFANPDMVAHTGNIAATIKAVEEVDKAIGLIANVALKTQTLLAITSDHGNAEEMIDLKTGNPKTAHTSNPVPFILLSKKMTKYNISLIDGGLRDIAPTLLTIMNLTIPFEMTGKSLIED